MELKFDRAALSIDVNPVIYEPIVALMMGLISEYSLAHSFVESILDASDWPEFLKKEKPVASVVRATQKHYIYLFEDAALWTSMSAHEGVGIRGFCKSEEAAASILERIRKETQRRKNNEETVAVNFWHWSMQSGAIQRMNQLNCPNWDIISANYNEKVQGALARLTKYDTRSDELNAGRILLWCGAPGTGKTWAIRMLARAWKWATVHYIIDPDEFFSRADYMVQALGTMQSNETTWDYSNDDRPVVQSVSKKWNLLVLEDAGELVSADAKVRTGQGLSKLLNLTDGLVGQGTNLMVLITTNEEFGSLHPAISRYGRCLSNIPFKGLSETETHNWLKAHNFKGEMPRSGKNLSELYGLLAGVDTSDKSSVGFKA